jgi:hypothetical protein
MDIEIFADRLRRLNRETQASTGGKARTNQLRSKLNQLKEINRKQGHKTTKSGPNVLKLGNKKKKDSMALVANSGDTMRTRKYKNPFSKNNGGTASTNGVVKKKSVSVKDEKRSKMGQKGKTLSKAGFYNVASIIGKRNKSKQKDQEKVGNSKA